MNKTIFMFRTVTLRPHWFQYIINETGSLCLLVASIWIYKFCSFAYHEWAIYACILLLFHLLFKLVYLARMEYIITGEQIIIIMGCSPTPLITWSYTELLTTSKVEACPNNFSV